MENKELTFDGFALSNELRNKISFPQCESWSESDWGNALAGEVGELCNFIKKRKLGKSIPVEELGKELGDIVVYADILARMLGLKLEDCVRNKFNEVSNRVNSKLKL